MHRIKLCTPFLSPSKSDVLFFIIPYIHFYSNYFQKDLQKCHYFQNKKKFSDIMNKSK
jgi:hypothetical protein